MKKTINRCHANGLPIGEIGEIDESATMADMRQNCSMFFRNSTGSRETFSTYRGQIIVRCTVQFTNCRPERKTVVYLYFPNGFIDGGHGSDAFCISAGNDSVNSVASAKKLINKILDGGVYYYGI